MQWTYSYGNIYEVHSFSEPQGPAFIKASVVTTEFVKLHFHMASNISTVWHQNVADAHTSVLLKHLQNFVQIKLTTPNFSWKN